MITVAEKQSRVNERQEEALSRALTNRSLSNYPTIFREFMNRGIPESDIEPRVNIFTYQAWRALGRQVRKGEKGVKVCTFIPMDSKETDKETGEVKIKISSRPRMTTVFHVSQTDKREAV